MVLLGQAAVLPGQYSATSHAPEAALQTVADDAKPSAGHAVELPLQASPTSQIPAEARHT